MKENSSVDLRKGRLFIDGKEVALQFPVVDAFESNSQVIVLLDPDAQTTKFGQFRNLIALDLDGRNVWQAELPTTETGDAYYKIASRNPLIANSVRSYRCEIDLRSCRIIRKEFYK